jgi:hypothetical protein
VPAPHRSAVDFRIYRFARSFARPCQRLTQRIASGCERANAPTCSWLRPQVIVAVATGHTSADAAAKARQHDVSTRTVKRCLSSVAYALLLTLCLILEMTLGELRDDPPYWAAMYTQWDETKQSLWFNINGRLIKQTVDVMVSKLVISWGWPGRPPPFPRMHSSANTVAQC